MVPVFERKVEKSINGYFDDPDSPVLVVEGARQIGKTFIIGRICRSRFKHVVEINFIEDRQGPRIFEKVDNIRDFYMLAQAYYGREMGDASDSVIFIDEIQEYPQFLTMLKFLKADGRYRYIASGSMLGIALRTTMSLPIGSISRLRMYTMDFEEFLWARGVSHDTTERLAAMVSEREEIPDGMHRMFLREFRDYLICGGLPYCVSDFIMKSDLVSLRKIQTQIFELYAEDASRYDRGSRLRTRAIYDLVSSTTEQRKKRIRMKDIEKKEFAKYSEYEEDFDSLIASGIVLEVRCCTDPVFPLRQTVKNSMLKLYMNDVGLLSNLLFRNNVKVILDDEPRVNLGNLYETAAAVMLSCSGRELYYSDSKRSGEVDFVIDDYERLGVVALEIKSGKDYRRHSALDLMMGSGSPPSEGIVFSNSGIVEVRDGIQYLPVYAVGFL